MGCHFHSYVTKSVNSVLLVDSSLPSQFARFDEARSHLGEVHTAKNSKLGTETLF